MRADCLIVTLTLVVNSSFAVAGPFGLEMGADIKTLDPNESGFKTSLNTVPNPHPLFDIYSVWHSDETGVCRILAISEPSENDRYGQDIRSKFDRVKSALEKKYSEFESIDFLRSGAIWKNSGEWVMSIRQNERTYAAVKEDATSESEEESYSLIQLWVDASSSDAAAILLEYRSQNFKACSESIKSDQDSSF